MEPSESSDEVGAAGAATDRAEPPAAAEASPPLDLGQRAPGDRRRRPRRLGAHDQVRGQRHPAAARRDDAGGDEHQAGARRDEGRARDGAAGARGRPDLSAPADRARLGDRKGALRRVRHATGRDTRRARPDPAGRRERQPGGDPGRAGRCRGRAGRRRRRHREGQGEGEAKQAKAETEAAQSKAQAAAGCARAYVEALGGLFEGDDPRAQAASVRKDLQSVTADCKDTLAAAQPGA